jgi:hypothetical protein
MELGIDAVRRVDRRGEHDPVDQRVAPVPQAGEAAVKRSLRLYSPGLRWNTDISAGERGATASTRTSGGAPMPALMIAWALMGCGSATT